MAANKKEKDLSFEDAMEELEEITRRLESGEDTLEESIKLYERGVELKSLCEKKLKEAEGKWKVLQKNNDGEVEAKEIPSSAIPEVNSGDTRQETIF